MIVDCRKLTGSLNFLGSEEKPATVEEGAAILAARPPHPDLAPQAELPDDTRLWAALQAASGGTWRGCVYDADRIIEVLEAGRTALAAKKS